MQTVGYDGYSGGLYGKSSSVSGTVYAESKTADDGRAGKFIVEFADGGSTKLHAVRGGSTGADEADSVLRIELSVSKREEYLWSVLLSAQVSRIAVIGAKVYADVMVLYEVGLFLPVVECLATCVEGYTHSGAVEKLLLIEREEVVELQGASGH